MKRTLFLKPMTRDKETKLSGIKQRCSECKAALQKPDLEKKDGLCFRCRAVLERYAS